MSDKNVSTFAINRLERISRRPAQRQADFVGGDRPPARSSPRPAAGPRHARRRRRHRRRVLRWAVVLALVAVVTGWLAWPAVGRHTSLADAASVAPPQPHPDWLALVQRLDREREAALAAGDEPALAAVYAAGSPAARRDVAHLRELERAGLRPRGLRFNSAAVRVVARDRQWIVLHVVDSLPDYELVDSGGRVARRYPGRGPATWRLTLARTSPGWRIYDVAQARAEGGGGR